MIKTEKENRKIETKYRWETLDVIPLLPFVGINNCQHILHTFKIMVHLYSTDERIHRFSIGYMVNSSLHVNKLFIEQVEIILNATFHERTMVPIIYVMKKEEYIYYCTNNIL